MSEFFDDKVRFSQAGRGDLICICAIDNDSYIPVYMRGIFVKVGGTTMNPYNKSLWYNARRPHATNSNDFIWVNSSMIVRVSDMSGRID